LPPISLEVHPSRFARLAWSLFVLVIAGALCLSPGPNPIWLLFFVPLALGLWWPAGRALLLGRGPRAVIRFEWASDGQWLLEYPDGGRQDAALLGTTVTLGPWLLMVWSVRAGPGRGPIGLRYAFIEASEVDRTLFRALKGRLLMAGGRGALVSTPAGPTQLIDSSHLSPASGHNPDRASCRR
jgi:hypothetical protein